MTTTTGVFDYARINSEFVYCLVSLSADGAHVKIGRSNSPLNRLTELMVGNPLPVAALLCIKCGPLWVATQMERFLHKHLADFRTQGEWFKFDLSNKDHRNAFKEARAAAITATRPAGGWVKISAAALKAHRKMMQRAKVANCRETKRMRKRDIRIGLDKAMAKAGHGIVHGRAIPMVDFTPVE